MGEHQFTQSATLEQAQDVIGEMRGVGATTRGIVQTGGLFLAGPLGLSGFAAISGGSAGVEYLTTNDAVAAATNLPFYSLKDLGANMETALDPNAALIDRLSSVFDGATSVADVIPIIGNVGRLVGKVRISPTFLKALEAGRHSPRMACMGNVGQARRKLREKFRRAFNSHAFGLEGDDLLSMHNLLESEHISIATIPQKQLREMFWTQQIVFREPVICTKKLTAFSLPLDPNRNARPPVTLVRRNKRGTQGNEYVATNGNHRIARHLTEKVTPSDLHVIIFEDGQAYKQLFGFDPTGYKRMGTETYSPVTDLGKYLDEFLR